MKTGVVIITSALSCVVLNYPLHAGEIVELNTVTGPASLTSPPPIPVSTNFVDNDEDPAQINFVQLFKALPITGATNPVDFVFSVADSGTGGTSEYLLNQWIVNATPVPWLSMRYSLSAKTTFGNTLVVPGLDFDWPDLTTLGFGSNNFPNVIHQPLDLFWSGGTAGIGANEFTVFAIDVPDIGIDYDIVLTLEVYGAGDLNGDGFVGISDLNNVLSNWNQNVPPADYRADPSGDGFVGIDDLNIVLGNWNAGTPPGEVPGVVPEPTSILAWSAGLLLIGRGRCRNAGD